MPCMRKLNRQYSASTVPRADDAAQDHLDAGLWANPSTQDSHVRLGDPDVDGISSTTSTPQHLQLQHAWPYSPSDQTSLPTNLPYLLDSSLPRCSYMHTLPGSLACHSALTNPALMGSSSTGQLLPSKSSLSPDTPTLHVPSPFLTSNTTSWTWKQKGLKLSDVLGVSPSAYVQPLSLNGTLPLGMHSLECFEFVSWLHTGYAGKVSKVFCPATGRFHCIKTYHLPDLGPDNLSNTLREVRIHESMCHPHVVRLLGAFIQGDFAVMIMQYVTCGDLGQILKNEGQLFEANVARDIVKPLLSALQFAHEQGVMHRDIKPANILWDGQQVYLCDFGLAIPPTHVVGSWGTAAYAAPEVILYDYHKQKYSFPADTWSMGVLVYELLSGMVPFGGGDGDSRIVIVNILRGNAMPSRPTGISDLAWDFITCALRMLPEHRPSMQALQEHPWIKAHTHRAPPALPAHSAPRSAGQAMVHHRFEDPWLPAAWSSSEGGAGGLLRGLSDPQCSAGRLAGRSWGGLGAAGYDVARH